MYVRIMCHLRDKYETFDWFNIQFVKGLFFYETRHKSLVYFGGKIVIWILAVEAVPGCRANSNLIFPPR